MRTTGSKSPSRTVLAHLVLMAAVVALLTACDSRRITTSESPAPEATPTGTVTHRDLAYGSDPRQRLDVYADAGAEDDPILLMVHGGSWVTGDKAGGGVIDNKVAHYVPEGFLVASTNYRFSPQVDPLAQAQDVADALAYVQQNATEWGGDPDRVVLLGHSAGGHLVSLVTADPTYRERAGARPGLGTVSLDGAGFDLTRIMAGPHLGLYDPVFGDPELQRAASPTLVIGGTPPPVLLICAPHGGIPEVCPQAEGFAEVVRAHGSNATVVSVDLGHGEVDSQVGVPGQLTDEVDNFLRSLGLDI